MDVPSAPKMNAKNVLMSISCSKEIAKCPVAKDGFQKKGNALYAKETAKTVTLPKSAMSAIMEANIQLVKN